MNCIDVYVSEDVYSQLFCSVAGILLLYFTSFWNICIFDVLRNVFHVNYTKIIKNDPKLGGKLKNELAKFAFNPLLNGTRPEPKKRILVNRDRPSLFM